MWTRGSSARWASGVAFAILLFVSCSSTTSPAQFPNMLGIWTGTLTFVGSINPPGASNTCTMSWTVTSQSAGQYSGVYQLTGGTENPCGGIGNVSGTVSTGGTISSLTFSPALGIVSMCTVSAGSGPQVFSGTVSGAALTAASTESIQCTSGSTTSVGSRSLTISVTKQ